MLLRPIISILGTDIGRCFEEISPENIVVKEDTSIMLHGMYRKIIIGKIN